MPVDFAGLLSRKYDILQQNSDAQNRLSWAQSGLIGAQTQTEPMEAAARAAAARGAGAAGFGQAALSTANATQVPGLATSEESERSAQANDLAAHSWLTHIQGTGDPNLTLAANTRFGFGGQAPGGGSPLAQPAGSVGGWGGGAGNILSLPQPAPSNVVGGRPDDRMQNNSFHFDTGTSDVPGKGSSKIDSVSAKLAPGEAVLNAAAAEHIGRSTIDFLNAIGAHKMGLTVGSGEAPDKSQPAKGSKDDSGVKVSNQTGDPPGYAMGTSNAGSPPAPGQTVTSGTWTPTQNIRQLAGMPGVPRPAPPQGTGQAKPAYKTGTSNVQKTSAQKSEGTKPKSKSSVAKVGKGPGGETLPPPGVMQALLAMGGGGGGMPPPGANPMPMPMPQLQR